MKTSDTNKNKQKKSNPEWSKLLASFTNRYKNGSMQKFVGFEVSDVRPA